MGSALPWVGVTLHPVLRRKALSCFDLIQQRGDFLVAFQTVETQVKVVGQEFAVGHTQSIFARYLMAHSFERAVLSA